VDDGKETDKLRQTAEVDAHAKRIEALEADNTRLLRERAELEQQLVTSGDATEKIRSQLLDLEARFHAAEQGLLDANYRHEESFVRLVKELGDAKHLADEKSGECGVKMYEAFRSQDGLQVQLNTATAERDAARSEVERQASAAAEAEGVIGEAAAHRDFQTRWDRVLAKYPFLMNHVRFLMFRESTTTPFPAGLWAIRELITAFGTKVDAVDDAGRTPLVYAATSGQVDAVALLLSLGASAQRSDAEGVGPIHMAAQGDHEEVIRQLVVAGANVSAPTRGDGSTPLHLSSGQGHEAAVRVLVGAGADLEARDDSGETPLIRAVREGHVVQTLCELGVNVTAPAADGATPLFIAGKRPRGTAKAAIVAAL
jgi:hypothetical protein